MVFECKVLYCTTLLRPEFVDIRFSQLPLILLHVVIVRKVEVAETIFRSLCAGICFYDNVVRVLLIVIQSSVFSLLFSLFEGIVFVKHVLFLYQLFLTTFYFWISFNVRLTLFLNLPLQRSLYSCKICHLSNNIELT